MKSNVYKYYIFNFFTGLYFYLPVFVLFFQSKSQSYLEILTLFTIQSITQFLLEFPSALLGDIYLGRKKTLILSALCFSISFFIIAYGFNFFYFTIGFIFLGLSKALSSGTDTSFLYDTLIVIKKEKYYKKYEGRAIGLNLLGMSIASLIGGYLSKYSLQHAMIATSYAGLLAFFVSLTFKEPITYLKLSKKHFIKTHIFNSYKSIIDNKNFFYLLIYTAILFTFMQISHRFFQPYLVDLKINITLFGYLYVFWMLFSSASAFFSHYLEKILRLEIILCIFLFFIAIPNFFMGSYISNIGIFVILLNEFVWGAIKPTLYNELNKEIKSSERVTVMSSIGFLKGLFLILFAPLFGYIADISNFHISLQLQGIVLLIIGLPILILYSAKIKRKIKI